MQIGAQRDLEGLICFILWGYKLFFILHGGSFLSMVAWLCRVGLVFLSFILDPDPAPNRTHHRDRDMDASPVRLSVGISRLVSLPESR